MSTLAGVRRKSRGQRRYEKLSALGLFHTLDESQIIVLVLDASEKISFTKNLDYFQIFQNIMFAQSATKIDKISNESKAKFAQEIERKIQFNSLLPIVYLSGKKGVEYEIFLALRLLVTSSEKNKSKQSKTTFFQKQ